MLIQFLGVLGSLTSPIPYRLVRKYEGPDGHLDHPSVFGRISELRVCKFVVVSKLMKY